MKIRMLMDRIGAADGIHPVLHEAGKEYDIPDDLARVWIDRGRCVRAGGVVKVEDGPAGGGQKTSETSDKPGVSPVPSVKTKKTRRGK